MRGPRPRRPSQGRYKELVDGVMPQPEGSLDLLSRPQWMRLLALAEWTDLEARSRDLAGHPHDVLRAPETGLVMLRGRMGATGAAFNLGEATITRCAVRLTTGEEGHAYVLGRNADHAHRAALCDALMQRPEDAGSIRQDVLSPIADAIRARQQRAAGKAAATKVDFFTLVRGDV